MSGRFDVVYWTLLLVTCLGSVRCQGDCLGVDQCSCSYSDGKSVYLNSLGNTDGTPRFKDIPSDDGSTYSYNPCYPFSEDDGCQQVAACEINTIQQASDIGDQQTALFGAGASGLEVGYTAGRGLLTTTTVQLVCDPHACTPTMTAQGQSGPNSFTLTLKTVCACPGLCKEDGPVKPCTGGGGGIGGGAVFLILLASLLLVYIVGGVAFMKFVRHAQGKELVPNYGFWSSLPDYIKSGTLFVLQPCTKKPVSYNSI